MSDDTTLRQFWHWFKQNEDMVFHFERNQEHALDSFAAALAGVSPNLTFEIGPAKNGIRDLVISADGIKSAFPFVEALVAAAPALPRWELIAFRPRRKLGMGVSLAGRRVKPEDVEFCLLSNGLELGVYLFLPDYSEEEKRIWGQIGYLLLDEALGEYDVETKLGPIKFFHASAYPDSARRPLPDLPELFDERYAALKRAL